MAHESLLDAPADTLGALDSRINTSRSEVQLNQVAGRNPDNLVAARDLGAERGQACRRGRAAEGGPAQAYGLINPTTIEAVTAAVDGTPQAVIHCPDAEEALLLAGACALLAGCGGCKESAADRRLWWQTDASRSTNEHRAPQHRPADDQVNSHEHYDAHAQDKAAALTIRLDGGSRRTRPPVRVLVQPRFFDTTVVTGVW